MNVNSVRFLLCFAGLGSILGAAPSTRPQPPSSEKFQLSDLLPRGLQKNPRLNLSIITEVAKEGKDSPPPSKEHPAYYSIWDGGLVEEGDIVAGEHPPPPARLADLMKASLAESGLEPASAAHPPTLVIRYRWGSFNHLTALSGESDEDVQKNLMTRAALVGGVPFAVEMMRAIRNRTLNYFRTRDSRTESLVVMAASDLYFLIASAYDYGAATHGQMKLLWCTKLSTDSRGLAMDDSLPALVLSAKTYFGHETSGSVLFHPRLFQGHVDLGEPTMTDYADPKSAPAENKSTSPKR